MKNLKFSALTIAMSLGAFSTGHAKSLAPLPPAILAEKMTAFQHQPAPPQEAWREIDNDGDCEVQELNLKFVSKLGDGAIHTKHVVLYRPNISGPVPVVIDIPTIEGETELENEIGYHFCSLGTALVMANVQANDIFQLTSLEQLDDTLVDGVLATRTLIDLLETEPQRFKTSQIGVLGISNGSYTAAMALAVDSRISKGLIMGAIGNVPHALSFSINDDIRDLRDKWIRKHGIKTRWEYENLLRPIITASPVEFAPLIARKRLHQILIDGDEIAPDEGQLELRTALTNAPQYSQETFYGLSHAWTIILTTFLDIESLSDFFHE